MVVKVDVRLDVAIEIHRHEGAELDETRINPAPAAFVAAGYAGDQVALKPLDRFTGGKLVDLRRIDASVDGAGHQRHAPWLGGASRVGHDGNSRQNLHARLTNGNHVGAPPEMLQEP